MSMAVLDVAIGVIFMYLLLSLIVTTAQEAIASFFHLRAQELFKSVRDMVADEELTMKVYHHPLIRNLVGKDLGAAPPGVFSGARLPSYIPSRTFALALLDVLRRQAKLDAAVGATQLLSEADQLVGKVDNPKLAATLRVLIGDARQFGTSLNERADIVSRRIEGWFNERMARTSGWYKRKAQIWSLVLAGVVTLIANGDTIYVANQLWSDAALRAAVVASAEAHVSQRAADPVESGPAEASSAAPVPAGASPAPPPLIEDFARLKDSRLPLGWTWQSGSLCARSGPQPNTCWSPTILDGVLLVCGWLVTALAVSLGATFWFDVLSRALQLRSSGPRISTATGRSEERGQVVVADT